MWIIRGKHLECVTEETSHGNAEGWHGGRRRGELYLKGKILAGYSGTPLAKKLGIKDGYRVRIRNAPANYLRLITPRPKNVTISPGISRDIDLWHLFTKSAADLQKQLPKLMRAIRSDGMIWVSWPKRSSGVASDVTEDTIRAAALPLGLVDVKVCAVDETWSGLKLVIRRKLRK